MNERDTKKMPKAFISKGKVTKGKYKRLCFFEENKVKKEERDRRKVRDEKEKERKK